MLFKDRYKEDPDYERRCYPSMDDIQVFQYRDDPPAYEIRAGFHDVRDLIRELRSPHHYNKIYCVRWFGGEQTFESTKQSSRQSIHYAVEQFGLKLEPHPSSDSILSEQMPPDSPQYICQPMYWRESPDYLVQVWRSRVYACLLSDIHTNPSSPLGPVMPLMMCFEERWHPNLGKRQSLSWLEYKHGSKAVREEFTEVALSILGRAKKKGRPPGITKHANPHEFILKLKEAFLTATRLTDGEPSRTLVAAQMEDISLGTFRDRLRRFNIQWPPEFL
jgi:hypothetical protein